MNNIKRPVALVGFTGFITGSVVLSMPREYIIILLALFALFTIFHYCTNRKYTKHLATVFVIAVITMIYVILYSKVYVTNIEKISTDTKTYIGYINSITNSDGTGYIVTILDENNREKYAVSVYYQEGFEPGDVIEITGRFSANKNDNYIFTNYSRGIKGRISADKIELTDRQITTVKYMGLTAKASLIGNAEELYSGKNFPIVASMGYGDKSQLSPEIKAMFKTAGISHALVISGFHIAIIVFLIQLLLKYLPLNKKLKNLLTCIFIVIFMNLHG